ncbi:MAG: hypothetical protein KDD70_07605 [Bdellovibrionales bacterium]|nr:hypothetical protein [Bdellovibrionales bacterium]
MPSEESDRNLSLNADHFLWPVFVARETLRNTSTLPPFFSIAYGMDDVIGAAHRATTLGLGGLVLYELGCEKSSNAASSLDPEGIIPEALRTISEHYPDLLTVSDLCVCQYTVDSHCRINGDCQQTSDHLLKQAALYLNSGAKALMPSAMIPHFSKTLREWSLTEFGAAPVIISQTAKFASPLYSPFRSSEAMRPQVDKHEYQIAQYDTDLALTLLSDEQSGGADLALIKPGIAYSDLLRTAVQSFPGQQFGAFITSGEHQLLIELEAKIGAPNFLLKSTISSLITQGARYIVTYQADKLVEEFQKFS